MPDAPHPLACELLVVRALRFDDGAPVRAASAVAPLGDGWLVAQDDATHGAWLRRDGRVERLRLLDPVDGLDTFCAASGTKHLKPDLEAACTITVDDAGPVVVLLGSGSLPARMRGVLVRGEGERVSSADLTPLYTSVAEALSVDLVDLNLEGATVVDGALRWFQRGIPARDVVSASIDVDLDGLLATLRGEGDAAAVGLGSRLSYDVGTVAGHALTITDAVTLQDGAVLVSAAAELTPNAVDDGAVLGSALALLGQTGGPRPAPIDVDGAPVKVEGLALLEESDGHATVLAVVDDDDPARASLALTIAVRRR